MKRIVIMSDVQIPYHNPKQLTKFIEFVGAYQPDELLCIGDFMDFPQPSRWNKDTRGEFEGSIFRDAEVGKKWLQKIRDVFDGPFKFHAGNHDERPESYLKQYAPALVGEGASPYNIGTMLDFEGFGITDVGGFHDIAPGWISTHGHLGRGLSTYAGGSAIKFARQYGKCVLMGHTHRMGIVGESSGYGGNLRTIVGFECGHMMQVSKATYLKDGRGNWQSGFGVMWIDGIKVTPVGVPMRQDGGFVFGGEKW
ncbi:hypothetical protein Lfu02_55300 [Longispora fulva]|uniref:Putative phosphodiesterase n=1 Tax=Longispora fulva TaxID=619741 RepID=A0A8J7GRQ3_9ACTN|nr:metallophosphoesterase [Longispora fulva]MBG6137489.1 putative phosphodiesterase [Longispora fulva]GIG61158.1 hypothetical protein Lfu02_55300 [Longispora fulva]